MVRGEKYFPRIEANNDQNMAPRLAGILHGPVKMGSPPRHDIAFGDVRIEVDFLAMDLEDDIGKMRSADYTGGCFHEVQYIDLEIFREGRSRTNRYPEEGDGGATWSGVIADCNAPDEDHWLAV